MLLYQRESELILNAFFEVNKYLTYGLTEKVYERALVYELRQRDLDVVEQQPLAVNYKGMVIGDFKADVMVEGKIILELKAQHSIIGENIAQLINYLTITGFSLGYILNFGHDKDYKRVINSHYK
jgi:GxxExxY protein